jgi:hypothetical protein
LLYSPFSDVESTSGGCKKPPPMDYAGTLKSADFET